MKKFILLAILCPLLQGCVGFVVVKQRTVVINDPVISLRPNSELPAYSRERARKFMAISHMDEVTNRVSYPTPWLRPYWGTNVVYTSAWLQTHWGSPNRICRSPSCVDEVWTYRFGPIWKGIMPWLIVPIPLRLPVGENKVCFTLRDGQVTSVSSTTPALGGFFWPTGM